MDRAGVDSGVRRGHWCEGARSGGPPHQGQRRRWPGAMAAAGEADQGDARHLRARRRGHDFAWRPA